MANVSGASLSPIYNRLNSALQYHPMEASTFADWALEAGDVVTVSRDGKNYQSPVHTAEVTWKKTQEVNISSGGNEKRQAVSKVSQRKYRSGGSGLYSQHYWVKEVEDKYSQMVSGIMLTGSAAAMYVNDKYGQMGAGLYLTASSASLQVSGAYSKLQSGLYLTASSASLQVKNAYTQMKSGLDLTASSAALYVDSAYDQMSSGLYLTSSSASLQVKNAYSQMRSGLDLTSSSAALYVDSAYDQMSSGLYLTSSSASLQVSGAYSQMSSGLYLTSSSASLQVKNAYKQMRSGLDLTSSSAALYVDSAYDQMSSGLYLTSSSASLQVSGAYSQMSSGLYLTSSSAALQVKNAYSQMRSGLDLTSSSLSLYVDSAYDQMSSGLDITSSSLAAYVESKYSDMKSGLELTESSATLYARNRTTRASIVARINESGKGEVLIDADNIRLTGATTLNSVFSVESGNLTGITMIGKRIQTKDFVAETGGRFRLIGTGTGEYYDIDGATIQGMVKSFSFDKTTNTLTLTPFYGEPINFSKATSLSGAWSGNQIVVSAKQGSETVSTYSIGFDQTGTMPLTIAMNGAATAVQQRKSANVPVRIIQWIGSTQTDRYTTNLTANCEVVWNNGWDDARAKMAWPSAATAGTEVLSFDVKFPNAARDGQDTHTFTLSKGTPGTSGYASVAMGNIVVGRIDISNWYTSGRSAATLSGPFWPSVDGTTTANTTVTFQNAYNSQKTGSTPLQLRDSDWSSGSKNVDLYDATSGGTIRARKTVSIPGATSNGLEANPNNATQYRGYVVVGGARRETEWSTAPYTAGWTAARGKVEWPTSASTGTSVTIKKPSATAGSTVQDSITYTLADDGDNAVKLYTPISGTNVTVAKLTHNKYTAGWTAARGKVEWPTSAATGTSITIKKPSSTAGSTTQDSITYTLANDGDDAVKLYTPINGTNVTVAKLTHNKYTSGWTTARGKVEWPTSAATGTSITIKKPSATAGSTVQDSITYTLADIDNNSVKLYTTVNGTNVTVAKLTHGKYDAGAAAVVLSQAWAFTTTSSTDPELGYTNTCNAGTTAPHKQDASTGINLSQGSSGWQTDSSGNYYINLYVRRGVTIGSGVFLCKRVVDGTTPYNAGWDAVSFNSTISWSTSSGILPTTNTATMSISSKKSGTARSKSLQLTLTVATWTNGYIDVYMREGGTSGTLRAGTSVSMPQVTANSTVFEVKSDDATQYRARFNIGGVTRYTDYSNTVYNAVKVTGSWSNNKFTYSKSTSGSNSGSFTVTTAFDHSTDGYYIEAKQKTGSSTAASIASSYTFYQLGRNGNSIEVQNTSGTRISDTATYELTSHTKCIAGVTRVQMTAGSYFHGVLYYLDGGVYKTITNEDSYWYYKKNTGSSGSYGLTTYYS